MLFFDRKIKTIAWQLVRELGRKLHEGLYRSELKEFRKFLGQKREDKNKIYSLHEPKIACTAKDKEYKKFEFVSKASFGITRTTI